MERKDFLRNMFIGATSASLILQACKKDSSTTSSSSGTSTGTNTGTSSGSCTVSPTETQGPFPTITPSSLVRSDIRVDRTGVGFTVKIYVMNKNTSCSPLANAIVDIWHCDKDGYYSEYGGSGMQSVDYTGVHFLRGRQTTDANGLVTFTSIFPGWYSGRATHIHVHIYNASGTSLLITQIAFPEGSTSAVATVNGTAGVAYGYNKGMSGYTYNASDNIFSDDTAGAEIGTIAGNISDGYTITQNIYVAA
ncbi:MAG: intradiol ring-cleavage dioxygenase [Sphingobacteriales bacterium]|nr:intradiol ring-cleavage dioxygenase [Sphingobacteriales bacterium]MBI3719048.1 intradiol ring-cleavage dioxygenase [Sphingobacteriales bacterium]